MTKIYDSITDKIVGQFKIRDHAIEFIKAANRSYGFERLEAK